MADSTSESAQQEGKAQGDSMDDPNSTNIDMKTVSSRTSMSIDNSIYRWFGWNWNLLDKFVWTIILNV